MDATKKIDLKLDAEMSKWVDLYYASLAVVLHRYWGYGTKRINNIIDTAYAAADECAGYGIDKSMVQMFDEETGIELRSYTDNRSYKETAFLSTNIKYKKLNRAQYICMRTSQIKWMRPTVLSGLCLAMYRSYGFGAERLQRLINQMDELIEEYSENVKAVLKVAEDEVGFKMVKR